MLFALFYFYLFLNFVYGNPPYRETTVLPHCSRNPIMEGQIESSSDDGTTSNITGSIQFHMALNEIACIRFHSNKTLPGGLSSILHSIEFLRLEHHYSIKGKYKFGIPSISTDCKCDCAGGDTICSLEEYEYKNCTSPSPLCYGTYKSQQSSTGCFSSAPSNVCCKTSIQPHENWIFQAIKLAQPSTVLVLRYRIFEKFNRGWKKAVDRNIEVLLNHGVAKFDLNTEHNVEILAGGSRPHRQLEPGVYFWRIGETSVNEKPLLRGDVAINDLGEGSLDKLGWFRFENNAWTIPNGLAKITQAQHVQIENCKAQTYSTTLIAEQYVLGDHKKFNLGSAVNDDPWVADVEIGSRSVKIDHGEGTNLLLTLKALAQPRAIHHISQFSSFNGSIQLDKESNRFLNLTFLDPRGTLIGQVFTSESRAQMDIVFSVQTSETIIGQYKAIVSLPASIESRRYVCIHASGDLDSQQCQWFEYKADPLNEYRVAHRWQQAHSDCVGCNERGVDLFLTNLDPRRWFDGLNSPAEIIMCIFEVVLAVVALMATIALCTKCFIPLARWLICIPKVPKK